MAVFLWVEYWRTSRADYQIMVVFSFVGVILVWLWLLKFYFIAVLLFVLYASALLVLSLAYSMSFSASLRRRSTRPAISVVIFLAVGAIFGLGDLGDILVLFVGYSSDFSPTSPYVSWVGEVFVDNSPVTQFHLVVFKLFVAETLISNFYLFGIIVFGVIVLCHSVFASRLPAGFSLKTQANQRRQLLRTPLTQRRYKRPRG